MRFAATVLVSTLLMASSVHALTPLTPSDVQGDEFLKNVIIGHSMLNIDVLSSKFDCGAKTGYEIFKDSNVKTYQKVMAQRSSQQFSIEEYNYTVTLESMQRLCTLAKKPVTDQMNSVLTFSTMLSRQSEDAGNAILSGYIHAHHDFKLLLNCSSNSDSPSHSRIENISVVQEQIAKYFEKVKDNETIKFKFLEIPMVYVIDHIIMSKFKFNNECV